jgi:hypothetical protein
MFLAVLFAQAVFGALVLFGIGFYAQKGVEQIKIQANGMFQKGKLIARLAADRTRALEMMEEELRVSLPHMSEEESKNISDFLITQEIFYTRISEDEFILRDNKPSWSLEGEDPMNFLWED